VSRIIRQEKIKFASKAEYDSAKSKLKDDAIYASALQLVTKLDDTALEISYKTEEIVPKKSKSRRIKVLLLFKNPHPGSVDAGLFFAANHSKTFWQRVFDVSYNEKLRPLLESENSWIKDIGKALTSGNYDRPFLYYFKCLYPFPTNQFADLRKLFSRAPLTRKEFYDRSIREFHGFVKTHNIKNVIVFFIDGMRTLTDGSFPRSNIIISNIKHGIDTYVSKGDPALFWKSYKGLKLKSPEGITFYYNMNTRTKNQGVHLPKRYFTYNLEFILHDILEDSRKETCR